MQVSKYKRHNLMTILIICLIEIFSNFSFVFLEGSPWAGLRAGRWNLNMGDWTRTGLLLWSSLISSHALCTVMKATRIRCTLTFVVCRCSSILQISIILILNKSWTYQTHKPLSLIIGITLFISSVFYFTFLLLKPFLWYFFVSFSIRYL